MVGRKETGGSLVVEHGKYGLSLPKARFIDSFVGRFCLVFLVTLLSLPPIFGMLKLNPFASAATSASVDYTYIGNVGNVVSAWSQNGDLVNPTMVAYSAGSSNFVYVYCDSTDMPYAGGGLISAQANPANWRTIVIFSDNGDGTFTYQSMVTVEIAGSGFSFNGGEPQGMTVDSNGVIYMTAPTNALVAVYQSNATTPTVQSPTFIGPVSAANGYTGSVLGAPSIDHTDGSVIVGGDFNGGSALNYATYGVAKIIPTSPTAATDVPQLFVPYTSGGNNYYVENVAVSSSGNHLAAGYFSINGQSYNVIEVDLATGAITPITPLNITGLNNSQESASIYGMTSLKSDANGNIYLAGSFGVNNAGQYQASSLLKLDQNGNFVTDIAPQTNTPSTTGQLNNPNMLAVNGINQWVYIVDTGNSSGAAVRAFAFNGTLPGSGNTTPSVTIPPSSVNLDTNTGVVFAAPPTGGGITTITNSAQPSFGCNTTLPPEVVMIINTDDISTGIPISTSIVDPNTGNTVATSFIVYSDGSTTMALTTGSDGTTVSGTGTPTTSDGVTTATINLTAADGTTLTNTVTTAPDASGGTAIYSVKTITQPDGYVSTTAIRIATTATGEIDLSLQLPNITTGDNYCSTVSTNNGSGAAAPVIIPWTAGLADSSINFSEVYCSDDPFAIDILPTAEGTLGMDCVTITTATNNPTGYSTTLSADSSDLVCTADSGTYSLASASSTPSALGNNQWGYYIGADTPAAFQAVPTVPAVIQSNTASAIGDSFKFWIGAQLDLSQPSCTYTGNITTTASANPVPAPTITSISPTSGSASGSTPITVTGTNFGTTDIPYISQITIGGTSCLFFAVVDNETATCIAPALAAGTYDVTADGFGGSATLPDSFTYQASQATACMSSDSTTANINIDRDANMLPVTFTGTSSSPSWAIADNTNWCSYSNQQWANAVTVANPATYAHALPGTNVPESDILGYWVYIPRYAYEVPRYYAFNAPVVAQNFNIVFETASAAKKIPQSPTGSYSTCFTAPNSSSYTSHDYRTDCGVSRTYGDATGTAWGTHPAFTFNDKELNGFWVGKFITSGTRAVPEIKPNQQAKIGEYPGTYYDMGKAMGVLDNNAAGGNGTSVTQNSHSLASYKTHMALNSDWGAVTYLAASQYGAGYNAVQINGAFGSPSSNTDADGNGGTYLLNDIAGITGCGPSASGSTSTYAGGSTLNATTTQSVTACANDTTHAYQGTIGVLASTTNNVYGVYDMVGGAYNMVMANYNNTSTNMTTMPPAAYINLYMASPFNTQPAWSSSSNATYFGFDVCNWTLCGGQANYEVNTAQSVTADSAWNGDYSRMPSANGYVWVLRGGSATSGANAGIFAQSDGNGAQQAYIGFRAVLGEY